MHRLENDTFWARIYLSGPIEVAKQELRAECMSRGLCVTIEPTTFIYVGGEEVGYVVGLINYPKYPTSEDHLTALAHSIAIRLMTATFQDSALVMTPETTRWVSNRLPPTAAMDGK